MKCVRPHLLFSILGLSLALSAKADPPEAKDKEPEEPTAFSAGTKRKAFFTKMLKDAQGERPTLPNTRLLKDEADKGGGARCLLGPTDDEVVRVWMQVEANDPAAKASLSIKPTLDGSGTVPRYEGGFYVTNFHLAPWVKDLGKLEEALKAQAGKPAELTLEKNKDGQYMVTAMRPLAKL